MKALFVAISLILTSNVSFGHGKKTHSYDEVKSTSKAPINQKRILKEINQSYIQVVKPIFEKSCFDCHSSKTRYPWYFSIPFAKGLIRKDIEEGLMHLDFSSDFPFGGHGSPVEDLKEIRESISKNEMPPLRYKVMHWGSSLSQNEKQIILSWINESLKKLGVQNEQ